MTSLKARALTFMMQNRHLLRGKLQRETWDENTSVPAYRAMCAQTNGQMAQMAAGVSVTPVDIAGMYAEWLTPANAAPQRAILYTVGGGYISGCCADHRAFVSKIAAGSGVPVLVFDHRLAPEHPFPAALDDAVLAYRWLLEQGLPPENIMIVGESAGGGLCLATLLALRDGGDPLPSAAVAISPWTDLKLTGESRRTRQKVCLSPPGMAEVCSRYYAGDHDPGDPLISPLYGDLHGLPPLMIVAGDWDTLIDDATRFAAKARLAGVDVRLIVGERMVHCYPLLAPLFPEATAALQEICAFIQAHLGR